MSSTTEPQHLLALFASLANGGRRQEQARLLAAALGAEDLLVFVPDPETEVLLPAPGLVQTLPQGRAWQRFLMTCLHQGSAQETLPFPDPDTLRVVIGLAGAQRTVLVLVGGVPRLKEAQLLCTLLPLLEAAFSREQARLVAEAQTAIAQATASEAQTVVTVLERTREELAQELLLRTQMQASLQQQMRFATLQMEISTALQQGDTLQKMLGPCALALVKYVDAAFARIWTLDEATQILELQASAGMYTHLNGGHARVPVGVLKIGRIAARRTPYLTNDVLHDPEISDPDWAAREGMVAFAGYPLCVGERFVGVMALFARTPLNEAVAEAMGTVANRIALGVERWWMQQERTRLLRREREARAQAEQERQHLYTLFEQAPAAIVIVRGPTYVVELANPITLALWGRTREQVLGRSLFEALPEIRGQGLDVLLDGVVTTGVPYVGNELKVPLDRHGDGQLEDTYFTFVYAPLRNASEEIEGVLVFAYEVTEQVRARERLAASQARFRLLAEQMPQKVFTALPNGDVDYFNPQWTQFTGLPFEQIRAWGWTQFIHPDDLEENLRLWREALATGTPFYCEHRFRRADGVYCWHVSRAVPLRDEAGKISMWIGSNTEIEEQKQLEERKDEFLRMASHDLRSPLTAIKGNLQLSLRQLKRLLSSSGAGEFVSRRPLEDLTRMLERALRQTEVQNRLISDLLDVSRIQAGKLELSLAPCDLVVLVQQIVQDYQARVTDRTMTLALPEIGQPVVVEADADRLGQVLSNFLTNALKYTPASSPLEIGIQEQGEQARVWVRDHGPGLTREQQQRIWERYYQAEGIATQQGASQGLGLGLHICRALISQHGGTVGVESVPGEGATFWFALPFQSTMKQATETVPQRPVNEEAAGNEH